jgi:hypothetical protein
MWPSPSMIGWSRESRIWVALWLLIVTPHEKWKCHYILARKWIVSLAPRPGRLIPSLPTIDENLRFTANVMRKARRAALVAADLSAMNLSYALLSGADLAGVSLSGANLSDTEFVSAGLTRANLEGAYLSRTDLSGANLSGVTMSGAVLTSAQMDSVVRY